MLLLSKGKLYWCNETKTKRNFFLKSDELKASIQKRGPPNFKSAEFCFKIRKKVAGSETAPHCNALIQLKLTSNVFYFIENENLNRQPMYKRALVS